MKYKGIELDEIDIKKAYWTVYDSPHRMLVWDDGDYSTPYEEDVLAILPARAHGYQVLTADASFGHCAEIPKVEGVTYRELARWLAEGNGEMRRSRDECMVYTSWLYDNSKANEPIDASIIVRTWDDEDWHAPTRAYLLGLENA